MQDGQLCLLSPGESGGHIQFSGRRNKRGKKLVGLTVERLGWRKRGRGPESIALVFTFEAELN